MHIDNIMDELISKYSEDDIRNAYEKAVKKSVDNKRKEKIADKRNKVLAALTDYLIEAFGEINTDLVKDFEKELITIEGKSAGTSDEPVKKPEVKVYTNIMDDEKLRKFIDNMMKF